MIPEFPNEAGPGNPVTALDILTQDGVVLRWTFEAPIQQSRVMMALGALFASLTPVMPELSFPEENDKGEAERFAEQLWGKSVVGQEERELGHETS